MRLLTFALIFVLIGALMLDPYTYGSVGGDRHLSASHPWQLWATAALAALLLGAAIQRSRATAVKLLVTELLAFLALNAIYVVRDGLITRSTVGNYGYSLPGMVVLVGILLRLCLIALFRWERRDAPRPGKLPERG